MTLPVGGRKWTILPALAALLIFGECATPGQKDRGDPRPAPGAEGLLDSKSDIVRQCAARLVFCVDANGNALAGETDPRVAPGDSLTVDVVDCASNFPSGQVIRLESVGTSPAFVVSPGAGGAAGGVGGGGPAGSSGAAGTMGGAGAPGGGTGAGAQLPNLASAAGAAGAAGSPGAAGAGDAGAGTGPQEVLLAQIHIPDIPAGTSLTVTFHRYQTVSPTAAVLAQRSLDFNVGKNGYTFEPTILFPTIFDGSRTITPIPTTGGRTAVVHADESNLGALDNISLGINIYPLGYPPEKCPFAKDASASQVLVPFVCNWRFILKPLALQIGTSISHNAFHQYYVGAGYGVVRGITVTFGTAFVQGDFFGPTIFEGQVIPSGMSLPPGAVEQKYMLRPYFGVSLSPEILESALQVLNQVKSLAPPGPTE
jgi:hypothetical protein